MTPRILNDGTCEMHGVGRYVTVTFPMGDTKPYISFRPIITRVDGRVFQEEDTSVAGGVPLWAIPSVIAEINEAYEYALAEWARREGESK